MLNNINLSKIDKSSINNRFVYSAKILKNNPSSEDFVSNSYPKHRPLKIYRRQYPESNNISESRLSAVGVFDKPGISTQEKCGDCSLNNFIINILNSNKPISNCENILKCNNGATNLNKKEPYSFSNQQYLYSKNKTYHQNISTKYLYVKNTHCTPVYKTGCNIKIENSNRNNTTCTNINNEPSISSSGRIERLKYETSQKFKYNNNNNSLKQTQIINSKNCNTANLLFNKKKLICN